MPTSRTNYELRIIYTVNTLQHIARLGLAIEIIPSVGQSFDTIVVPLRNAATTFLDFVVDELVTVMKPLYGAADDIQRAELWFNDQESDASFFISNYDISEAGSGANGLATRQLIYTARSEAGHVSKFYLMEPNVNTDAQFRPPFTAGAMKNLMDYLISDTTPWFNGDSTFVIVPLGISGGQNEAIWRKRNRP